MRVCGIIAEYDPFTRGHLHHLTQARARTGADFVICAISSAFTQRGLPALFATHQRARMALLQGADLVLGMPVSYSCAGADRFAVGGVGILQALGPVTHLSFGVEEGLEEQLAPTAALLGRPDEGFRALLRAKLAEGKSFARAQGEALAMRLPQLRPEALRQPNFILGLSYLKALQALDSPIQAIPVPRHSAYHGRSIEGLPSASALRLALRRGDWAGLKASLPESSYRCIQDAVKAGSLHWPEALDLPLMQAALDGRDHSGIAEIAEGLDRRIQKLAPSAHGRESLARLVKSRRYPMSRVMRALTGLLLGLQAEPLAQPAYARLLGFRRSAAELLQQIGRSGFPLITRPAREQRPGLRQDMQAEQLWHLGAGQPAARAFEQQIIIV